MNWEWATSLDQLWRTPAFPMWLTLAAACFFGLILLITLVRAEKSVANGALTVITLLAIGIAVAATIRVYAPEAGRDAPGEAAAQPAITAALPALACLDDIAGDVVQAACEKALFGSPDGAAAAVNYTAAQISRLTALGEAASADKIMTPELRSLRRALEHDRYGLVAQVLVARDNCTQFECAAFRSLTNRQQVAANMDAHLYDQLIARFAPTWNAPAAPAPAAIAGLPPSMPTGRPTNAEFPSASSTPAVSIMAPEPPTGTARQGSSAAAPAQRPAAPAQAAAPPAAKKPPAPKAAARAPAAAPVPLAPAAQTPAAAQAPPPWAPPAPAAADNQ